MQNRISHTDRTSQFDEIAVRGQASSRCDLERSLSERRSPQAARSRIVKFCLKTKKSSDHLAVTSELSSSSQMTFPKVGHVSVSKPPTDGRRWVGRPWPGMGSWCKHLESCCSRRWVMTDSTSLRRFLLDWCRHWCSCTLIFDSLVLFRATGHRGWYISSR
jgi:hypothetical protein